jgi:hypothetical protein
VTLDRGTLTKRVGSQSASSLELVLAGIDVVLRRLRLPGRSTPKRRASRCGRPGELQVGRRESCLGAGSSIPTSSWLDDPLLAESPWGAPSGPVGASRRSRRSTEPSDGRDGPGGVHSGPGPAFEPPLHERDQPRYTLTWTTSNSQKAGGMAANPARRGAPAHPGWRPETHRLSASVSRSPSLPTPRTASAVGRAAAFATFTVAAMADRARCARGARRGGRRRVATEPR